MFFKKIKSLLSPTKTSPDEIDTKRALAKIKAIPVNGSNISTLLRQLNDYLIQKHNMKCHMPSNEVLVVRYVDYQREPTIDADYNFGIEVKSDAFDCYVIRYRSGYFEIYLVLENTHRYEEPSEDEITKYVYWFTQL